MSNLNTGTIIVKCYGKPGLTCYDGRVDEAYHGSPQWATCPQCKGTGQWERPMTPMEEMEDRITTLEKRVLTLEETTDA